MNSHLNIPKHIGYIMDGNRRWAKERNLPTLIGHKTGAETLKEIINYSQEIGVKAVSVYAFSTENWNRSKEEVQYLMDLFVNWVDKYLPEMKKRGICFKHLGSREKLSKKVLKSLDKAILETKQNTNFIFNMAINYGGRDEIVRAVNKIKVENKEITELEIESALDTFGSPDLDFIIRTSGEIRLSGFLLWQSSYAELYFSKLYWPDFSKKSLDEAILEFNERQRRFGK